MYLARAHRVKVFSLLVASLGVLMAVSSNAVLLSLFNQDPGDSQTGNPQLESTFRGPGTVVPSEGLAPFFALLIGGVALRL